MSYAERAEPERASGGAGGEPENAWIAARLEEVAELLEAQDADVFRSRAYRNAAATLRHLGPCASEIVEERGLAALRALDGVGESIARAIDELAHTGRLGLLERLRGEAGQEEALATVPGIGPELAHRIHEHLGVTDLYSLEAAAHDGRLARVPGLGPARVRAVREALAGRFRRPRPLHATAAAATEAPPPVAEILDVDREYRERAGEGELPRIAPRRFNPEHERWLSVMHTERDGRRYTALFSNTALAHRLGATHDWVVVYRDDHGGGGQWTVVTERRGRLEGRRVVRGREAECEELYNAAPAAERGRRSSR